MKSRRCGCTDDDPPPEFTPLEIRRLVGGAGGEREAVSKLLAVGLLREVSKTSIEFATDPGELRFEPETLEATLARIPNNDRRVPVPRRIVRLIAGGARRTLIATILGHLIRCLFYKRGMCHPKGCVKASWIAEVFGVSERRVTSSAGTSWRLAGSSRRRPPSGRSTATGSGSPSILHGMPSPRPRRGSTSRSSSRPGGGEGAQEPASPAGRHPGQTVTPSGRKSRQTVTPSYREHKNLFRERI